MCDFRDHSYRQSVPLLLLVIILRKMKLKTQFGDSLIIKTKNKTKSYLLTWGKASLPLSPPASFLIVRLTRPIYTVTLKTSWRQLRNLGSCRLQKSLRL